LMQKTFLDFVYRLADALVAGGQEADIGQQQQTRIHELRAISLHKAAALRIETFLADVGVNVLRDLFPVRARLLVGVVARRALERDPRHDLRVNKMLWLAAYFPNALIWLAPDAFQMFEKDLPDFRAARGRRQAALAPLLEHVGQLAINIQLQLLRCRVADAHG